MLCVIFYHKDTILVPSCQTETIYTKIKENYIYITMNPMISLFLLTLFAVY